MEIKKIQDGSSLVAVITGRINTNTAPQLEKELASALDDITDLVLDFGGVNYISSAGLRVVLSLRKTMSRKGSLVIRNVKSEVLEVFEMTGFLEFLTIE